MVTEYSDYGVEIAEAFKKYLKTGDMKLIEPYGARQLRAALGRLSPHYDNNKQWYREVESRIQELESEKAASKIRGQSWFPRWKEQWLGKLIFFVAGVLIGIIIRG